MKDYILVLVLFLLSACAQQSDLDRALSVIDSLKNDVQTLKTAQAMDNARNDKQDQRIDIIGTVAFTAWSKGKITDSLVNRRAFKRDGWGKVGSLLGGALGIKIVK